MLDHFIREDLKLKALRTMGVLNPLKVVITNYPEDQVEMLEAENNARIRRWATAKFRSPARSISSKTILWRIHRINISAYFPEMKCA